MNKPSYTFGDLVSVDGYHGAVFQVEAYRHEAFYSLTEQYTDHIYELVDVQTDAYCEADEDDLALLAPADQADEYIKALPKREITDGSYGFNFGLSPDWIDEALKHYREGEALGMAKEQRKPTARELSGQEAERKKQARKERAAKIDALLDEMNDYKRLVAEFGDEEYRAKVEYLTLKLAEVSGEGNEL